MALCCSTISGMVSSKIARPGGRQAQHEAAQVVTVGLALQQAALQQLLDGAAERVLGQAGGGDDVLGGDALLQPDGIERDEFRPDEAVARLDPAIDRIVEAEGDEVQPEGQPAGIVPELGDGERIEIAQRRLALTVDDAKERSERGA